MAHLMRIRRQSTGPRGDGVRFIIASGMPGIDCHSQQSAGPDQVEGLSHGLHGGGGGSEEDAGPAIASYVPSYQLKKGSILTASEQYIVHQCNCVSKFAKG